jgi:predicted DNA-binding transcriptional regulator YafY
MKNMHPTSRMLRLLSLLQTHRFWPGTELSDELDVSPRTLRRDIDRLRELGYPVHASRGIAGGYQLEAGSAMPPLVLEDDEAVAIALGLRTAANGSIEGIGETSVRALAKLEKVLPKHLRHQVHALQAYTEPVTWTRRITIDPEVLTVIAQACRDEERLQFEYERRDGEKMTRSVEPLRLVPYGQRWYLVAYDTGRNDWRTFRIDRLSDPRTSGARFVPRSLPADDAATFVKNSIGSMPTKWHAEVTVHAPLDEIAPRARWFRGTVTEGDTPDTCKLTISGDHLGWIVASITTLEYDFDVHGPPELVDYLRKLRGRIDRAAA